MNECLDIIIPVRNEADNLSELCKRTDDTLKAACIPYKLIFIDGSSTDDTLEILQRLSTQYPLLCYTQKGNGKADAILEGVEYATSDCVVMLDADLQYPPEVIAAMYAKRKDCPVIVANRKVRHERILRRIASKIHRFIYCQLLFGLRCDVQSGLKLFPRELASHVDMDLVTPWTLDLCLLVTARRLEYGIGEVPIIFSERRAGYSKVTIWRSFFEHTQSALRIKLRQYIRSK